jgi:hypothetical protein
MLELIWGILNFSILIYFIIICFNAVKVIRENLGGIAALVLVLGLLSFKMNSKNENDKIKTFDLQNISQKIEPENFKGNTHFNEKKLEGNLLTDFHMLIKYGEDNNEIKLLTAYVDRIGIEMGTEWKPSTVFLNKVHNNLYEYHISGSIDWKILGIRFYTQSKEFDGKIELKN